MGSFVESIFLPRTIRDIQRASQNPNPIPVQFLRKYQVRDILWVYYTWIDPKTDMKRTGSTKFQMLAEPFWLDADHKTMLALAGPEGNAYLLDAKLDVTNLSPEERRAIMQLAPPT